MTAAVAKKYYAACVASTDPLIVVSRHEPDVPVGLASIKPELFESKPSLHFLVLNWTTETKHNAAVKAAGIAEARLRLPKARFIVLGNSSSDVLALHEAGVASFLANELIFLDERPMLPRPAGGDTPAYDAVYNARLLHWKRHELARAVPKLLLIYGPPEDADVARVRKILPQAALANHDLNAGTYRQFDEAEVSRLLHRSSVGLCLSATEGAMRASAEYRLCGLPVVTTRSIGGRDRYMMGPHVRIVEDDPDAVAGAVVELQSAGFHPLAVREFFGRMIAFDRHNFLMDANKIVEKEFGVHNRFRSFLPFLRYPSIWRNLDDLVAPLKPQTPAA